MSSAAINDPRSETFLDRMIALVEGAERQKTPNEIALNILLAGMTIIFVFATATIPSYATYAGGAISVVVLVALVSLLNQLLACLPAVGSAPLSLQRMLGWLMAPVVWLAGIPWHEAVTAGALMGTKTVLNELLAYLDLARLPAEELSARSRLIMTYALCGFANFGSLGIMIGGIGTMVPERRAEIVSLGMKSIVGGTFATCLIGAVVGVIA